MVEMIKKAVIPAAGWGTRLLPATKEKPKEMLLIFVRLANGDVDVNSLLQLVSEQLYNYSSFAVYKGAGFSYLLLMASCCPSWVFQALSRSSPASSAGYSPGISSGGSSST